MSHYTLVNTKLTRRSSIVKALTAMGFSEESIEVSDTPMALKDYYGHEHKHKGQIRIKGRGWGYQVGRLSADLGFELAADGTYTMHMDSMDQGGRLGKSWQDKFLNQYGKAVIEEVCEEHHFFITSCQEEGEEIHITVQSPF